MKVVHIASGDLWAGAEKQLLSLACALRELPDTQVEAIILNPGTLADRLAASGIPTTVLDERMLGGGQLLRKLVEQLRQSRPDLVHTHRVKENILGAIAARLVGVPSLRTQHGAQEHPAAWHDVRRQILGAADFVVGRLLQCRIVAVSTPLAQSLSAKFGGARIVTIPNGIEPGNRPPAKPSHRPHWKIGIVGRLMPVKRVDLFLQIAAQMAASHPEANLHFRVIGDGPLRGELEQQATALPEGIDLVFCGHIDDAESAIAELDLLVICSDHEGLPMVALEAMKAGTVVVTHAIGGLPELLDNGHSGALAGAHSVSAFAKTIGELVTQPAQTAALAEKARTRLEENYSSAAMARAYRTLYAESLLR